MQTLRGFPLTVCPGWLLITLKLLIIQCGDCANALSIPWSLTAFWAKSSRWPRFDRYTRRSWAHSLHRQMLGATHWPPATGQIPAEWNKARPIGPPGYTVSKTNPTITEL